MAAMDEGLCMMAVPCSWAASYVTISFFCDFAILSNIGWTTSFSLYVLVTILLSFICSIPHRPTSCLLNWVVHQAQPPSSPFPYSHLT